MPSPTYLQSTLPQIAHALAPAKTVNQSLILRAVRADGSVLQQAFPDDAAMQNFLRVDGTTVEVISVSRTG